MSWRIIVISKPSKLDLRLGYMTVRDSETTVRIHIGEISVVVVESIMTSITSSLMNELIKNKIKVVFCDDKHNPSFELSSYYGCHDCSLKIRSQIKWGDEIKQLIWTCIVAEKIKKQAENLEFFNLAEAEKLFGYIEELEFNDATNREGHAAKVYFNAMFGKGFSRTDENPINAALNYGYNLILSCVNREVVCNGYLTELGLFHDNMFNKFNLSCDIMEPYRSIVDRIVKEMNPVKFEKEEKYAVASLLNSEIVIEGRKQTVLNGLKIYTKSVFDAIETKDESCLKFFRYEL